MTCAHGFALVGLVVTIACGDGSSVSAPAVPTPGGVVALSVASERVTSSSIALIADKQGVSVTEATQMAIFDASLAAAARRDLDPAVIRALTKTVLARAAIFDDWQRMRDEPVTLAELEEATQIFWLDYALPEGRRSGHAVVQVKPEDPPEVHEAARAMANRILEAVTQPVADSKRRPKPRVSRESRFAPGAFKQDPLLRAFLGAAKALQKSTSFKIVAEELPAVGRDSRQIAQGVATGASLDPAFTAAVWKLAERGQLSGVVRSSFGYHVIVLLEVTPANFVDEQQREEALRQRILSVRGKRSHRTLLEKLDASTKVELVPNHAALLGQINTRTESGDGEPGAAP